MAPTAREVARRTLPDPIRKRLGTAYTVARWGSIAVRRDLSNLRVHGRTGPRYAERVWINPLAVGTFVVDRNVNRAQTGQVVDGDWDRRTAPLSEQVKIRACELHWKDGVPWEETGVYEHMMEIIKERGSADSCRTMADVVARYERLDVMFQQICAEGQLRSRDELQRRGFRARGEIYIHIGRGPQLLFGGGGCHRFAAAQIAGLECIPAQLGAVHPHTLDNWTNVAMRSASRPAKCKHC